MKTFVILVVICVCAASKQRDRFKRSSKWDLHQALYIVGGDDSKVRRLIEDGADVNLTDGDNKLPIHWAALRGFDKVVSLLLNKGGSDQVHKHDSFGETPLHLAMYGGQEDVAKILLSYCNFTCYHSKNNKGQEPRDIARELNYQNLIDLLDSNQNGSTTTTTTTTTKRPHTSLTRRYTPFRPIIFETSTTEQTIRVPISSWPKDDELPSSKTKAAKKACRRYSTEQPEFLVNKGEPAEIDQFPWMVALGYFKPDGIEYNCGGTIISDEFVMTAAHCASEDEPPIIIRMGKVKLSDKDAFNYNIKVIIRHPGFTNEFKKNDIALIRTHKEILFSSTIRPACLETNMRDIDSYTKLDVTGWGSDSPENSKSRPDRLLFAKVITMPITQCNELYLNYNRMANSILLQYGISENQYCAYDQHGRKDSCKGDSGGPLQVHHNDYTAHVVGIVSIGLNCGTLPSIYTRVAYYVDWISSHVWPEST